MNITQKSIIDDIKLVLSKFKVTDENRIDEDWLASKINQVRAQLIQKQFSQSEQVDQTWLSDLGLITFHEVNFADDPSVDYCECNISKSFIPQTISLVSRYANWDLGIYTIISACGRNRYYTRPFVQWKYIPKDHEYSKFNYYSRINSAIYVNKVVDKLRVVAILYDPTDGKLIHSAPVVSGSLVSGTVYLVKGGQVIYNATVYNDGDTFTAGATANYTGDGRVYLNAQVVAYRETDPYPASADMVRDIVIEICTKEFEIEKGQIPDILNDSQDDSQKS